MGHETRLAFRFGEAGELDAILRAAPHFHHYDAAYRTYEYRGPENLERGYDMPDATVIIAADGLDCCAYAGGHVVRTLWHHLETTVRARFGDSHWLY